MSEDLDDFDEDLDEDLETPAVKTPAIASKQPGTPAKAGGDDISLFFMSTIGPGEKKQKLLINTGNAVGDIKNTVGSIFGINPSDFHLSHGGVTMDEGKYVMDYPVRDGDTVLLIPASTAGK
ncbi:MAG: ubiquitin-like domain-containing protein [Promethearchaeota archaeon]